MNSASQSQGMARNVALYPWFKFCQNLMFWQAIWFLYFQDRLSASDAILLYAIYDIATTLLEVPSGYASDRFGRKVTLLVSSVFGAVGVLTLGLADGIWLFVAGQFFLGASAAFVSGTDSSMLYESLHADGREGEVEAQELRGWRFMFAALAVSAVTGGVLSLWSFELVFFMSGVAMLASIAVVALMSEPPHDARSKESEALRISQLKDSFRHPVLIWLLCLSVLMYGYSHLPFVFGQPFILEALSAIGFAPEAPAVSGAVTTIMMIVSVLASLVVPALRRRFGLAIMLLSAFALQILLAAVLAATSATAAIGILFLRMVPSSISGPLVSARIQPLLGDSSRATFLSIKSLVGRLMFAGSLWAASLATTDVGEMSHADIRLVLGWYVAAGIAALTVLAFSARRIGIDG